jgi:Domain of unknown function (DUF4390)
VDPHGNPSFRSKAAIRAAGPLACVLGALVCLAGVAAAQPLVAQRPVELERVEPNDPGRFEVRAADVELDAGVYYLNARIEYRLSSEARDALHSGVPLRIRLDVEIIHPRRWWFDNDDAELRQLYQLEYQALSERYIVINVNSGEQASFGSLFAALDNLGRVEHLPLIDAALIEDGRDYDVRLRAVLDVEQFPGPLRLLAFWRRDWSIASDWYRWRLARN